ncbi:MAG: hypothetical protein AMXMBFR44_1320 [Candidatus Campbellbacteria bacterium]
MEGMMRRHTRRKTSNFGKMIDRGIWIRHRYIQNGIRRRIIDGRRSYIVRAHRGRSTSHRCRSTVTNMKARTI